MTASLKELPSISRLIAELNGDRSGVSLYDIVSKRCAWNVLPTYSEKDNRRTLTFSGGSGYEIFATYTATTQQLDRKFKRQIPHSDSLRISWDETRTQRFEILCESGGGLGMTFVRAFVIRGDAKFPVWGDPHPTKIGHIYWGTINERRLWDSEDADTATKKQGFEQIFAARMFLATHIDWERQILSGTFPESTKELGQRLGLLTDYNHTAW